MHLGLLFITLWDTVFGGKLETQSKMTQFEEYLNALCRAIRNGAFKNEAEVRSEFMRNVRNFLDDPNFKGISVREEESIIEGRPDARIGGLVIEFESPLDSKDILENV
jgi:hypothetical protein